MARHESDKEDLIADATALVHRAEIALTDNRAELPGHEIVTVGFRRDDCLSLYFDQDPFYQFSADGKLRRALEANVLFRSNGTSLARLTRERSDQKTTLQRTDLSESDLSDFRNRMVAHVTPLLAGLTAGTFHILRIVSSDDDFTGRLIPALQRVLSVGDDFLSDSIRSRK